MGKIFRMTGLAAILAFIASSAWGEQPCCKTRPGRGAGIVDSATIEKNVDRVLEEVRWFDSYEEARAEAQKQKKPIVWIHALGDLQGVT